jgi:hypothetical protein
MFPSSVEVGCRAIEAVVWSANGTELVLSAVAVTVASESVR